MKHSELTFTEPAPLERLLRQEFVRLNKTHFGGRLKMPEIVVSTRKTYGGYYQPAKHRIVVSWQAYTEHGLAETLNTFRHEMAHILHHNHSAAFWETAAMLGVTRRYASSPVVEVPPRPPRYLYACPACGKQVARHRCLRRAASCASCDPRFNPRFALQLVSDDFSQNACHNSSEGR